MSPNNTKTDCFVFNGYSTLVYCWTGRPGKRVARSFQSIAQRSACAVNVSERERDRETDGRLLAEVLVAVWPTLSPPLVCQPLAIPTAQYLWCPWKLDGNEVSFILSFYKIK